MKRSFLGDPRVDSAVHTHCSGLSGDLAVQVITVVLLRR